MGKASVMRTGTPGKASVREPSTRRLALAGLTGLLLAASYPSLGWWWLALVAYVPLLWAVAGIARARQGFVLGWVAGTVLHGLSFYWLSFTIREMSGLPTVVGWLVVLLHAAAMGLHQAVFAAAVVATRQWQSRVWWPAWVGVTLLAAEVIVPWQFPWYLGNAVYPAPVLLQAADVVGVVGVSALAAACSAVVVDALRAKSWRRGLFLVALLGCWTGYGALRLWMVEAVPVNRTLAVGLVQHNPSMKEKTSLKPGPRLPMFSRAIALTKQLPLDDLDLVIWPEGALPFFYVPLEVDKPGRAPPVLRRVTADLHAFAAKLGRPLIVGTLRMSDRQWKARPTNAAVVIDGTSTQAYDKHLLVPFGEYLPGRDLMPTLKDLVPGVSDLGAGQGTSVLEVRGVRLGMSICYEALFSGFMWRQTRDSDVLLNLTDDVWFGPTNAPELHLMVQIPRAVELRRPLLRATATGISAMVDAGGRVTARTPVWQTATRVVRVQLRDVGSPFRVWGPWPARALAALVAGLLLLVEWRRRAGLRVGVERDEGVAGS